MSCLGCVCVAYENRKNRVKTEFLERREKHKKTQMSTYINSTDRTERKVLRALQAQLKSSQEEVESLRQKAESLRLALRASQEAAVESKDRVMALELSRAHLEEVVAGLRKQVNSLVAQAQAGWKPLRARGLDAGTSPLTLRPLSGTQPRGRSPLLLTPPRAQLLAHSPIRTPATAMQHVASPPHVAGSPSRTTLLGATSPFPVPHALLPLLPSDLPSAANLYVREAVHMYVNTWTHDGSCFRALRDCPTFKGTNYQIFSRIKHAFQIYTVLVERGIVDPVQVMHQYLEGHKLGEKLYRLKKQNLTPEGIAQLVTGNLEYT